MDPGLGLIALALIMGIAAWAYHRNRIARADAATGWPTADGTITASRYQEVAEQTPDGDTRVRYFANVAYRYAVDGRTFTCERLSRHGIDPHSSLLQVQALISRYPSGSIVPVRYNPDDPGEALLEVNQPRLTLPLTVTAGALALGAAGLVLMGR